MSANNYVVWFTSKSYVGIEADSYNYHNAAGSDRLVTVEFKIGNRIVCSCNLDHIEYIKKEDSN